MRYISSIMILTLLLIATPSINSTHSGSLQELSIQNVGNILDQDDFAGTIFFEYGAESGVFQPPWDDVIGETTVSSAQARTGNYAIKIYQKDPPKTDDERRPKVKYYGMTTSEFYLSWWAYFPSDDDANWLTSPFADWGNTLGGINSFFDPTPYEGFSYSTPLRFDICGVHRKVMVEWQEPFGSYHYYGGTKHYIGDYLDQWVQFQLYVKWGKNNDGAFTCWFDGDVIANVSGITNDPRGHSEWDDWDCEFIFGTSYPYIVIENYTPKNAPECWLWVDDVVVATEKVSETYKVIGK